MYSKSEASKVRTDFWTKFGKYMLPVHSASSEKVNWVNYKTGVKHIRFLLDFTNSSASVIIVLLHTETEQRRKVIQYFESLLDELDTTGMGSWIINDFIMKEGKATGQISNSLDGVNIFQQETWPAAISFLKEQLIALDRFWFHHKDEFAMLNNV